MKSHRDRPIKQKLTLMIMLTSSAALLLAGAAIMGYELLSYRPVLLGRTASLADVIGANISAALVFKDNTSAEETLAALKVRHDVVGACLYGADGQEFVR